jgi:hypothetical protein
MKRVAAPENRRKNFDSTGRRRDDGRFTLGDIAELYRLERDRWCSPRGLTTRDRLTVARRYTPEWRR